MDRIERIDIAGAIPEHAEMRILISLALANPQCSHCPRASIEPVDGHVVPARAILGDRGHDAQIFAQQDQPPADIMPVYMSAESACSVGTISFMSVYASRMIYHSFPNALRLRVAKALRSAAMHHARRTRQMARGLN